MNRAYIEDAVTRIGEACERKGFRAVASVGDALSAEDLKRVTVGTDIRLPEDYRQFLMSANGLRIQFDPSGNGLVYTQDSFYMFSEGFLRQLATSFGDLFQQSVEFMLHDGHAKDPW